MNTEEYKILRKVEDSHWWYVGLRKLILPIANTNIKGNKKARILDAGCGTGKILDHYRAYKSYGIDASDVAITYCKSRKLENVIKGSICSMPYKYDSFDVVISLDVLYHKDVEDDVETMKELYQVLKKDGILLLNLPAYDFLKSKHDKAVYTKRRYTKKSLNDKLKKAGFEIEKITYRNTFLFPLVIIKRMIEKFFLSDLSDEASEVEQPPYFINKLLMYLLLFENKLITFGLTFPFGLSVYCIARKK